jgi:hypothetical protein
MNKSARGESSVIKQLSGIGDEVPVAPEKDHHCHTCCESRYRSWALFDRVLVDAECGSTDGSLKHIQQRLMKKEKQHQEDDDPSIPQLIPL